MKRRSFIGRLAGVLAAAAGAVFGVSYLKQFSPKSIGGAETDAENIRVTGSNGSEVKLGSRIGFENVNFPFTGTIKYISWNKMRTATFEVSLEIEILEPGNWVIEIQN